MRIRMGSFQDTWQRSECKVRLGKQPGFKAEALPLKLDKGVSQIIKSRQKTRLDALNLGERTLGDRENKYLEHKG